MCRASKLSIEMTLHLVVLLVTALATQFFISGRAESAAYAAGITEMSVTTRAEAQSLIRVLNNCTTSRVIDVIWHGRVAIDQIFNVSCGINLTVTGSPEPLAGGDAVIDNGGAIGIFSVSDASTLSLINLILDGGRSPDGGSVYAERLSRVNVLNCTFTHNEAAVLGGAIYLTNNSILGIYGATSFQNNLADDYGGAIYADKRSTIHIDGVATFENNEAGLGGGAIYVRDDSVLNIFGVAAFEANSAFYNGGAIYCSYSSIVHIDGVVTFEHNSADSGGAIFVRKDIVLDIIGVTTFETNSAISDGGAIRAVSSFITMDGVTTFSNNSAKNGGATYITLSDISTDGITIFTKNEAADDGGAIYAFGAHIYTGGTTSFVDNSADEGGAIFSELSFINIDDVTTFRNNSAISYGGGIRTEEVSSIDIDGVTSFENNSAEEGGAIYAARDSVLNIDGITTFEKNSADRSGGAIYTIDAFSINIGSHRNTIFISNSAKSNGGGIYASNAQVTVFGNTSFTDNIADIHGGGIYLATSSISVNEGVSFIENVAKSGGGAMWMSAPTAHNIYGSIFVSNVAEFGGAVWLTSTENISREFEECLFEGNEATDGGALYFYTSAGTDIISSSAFSYNHADVAGGAMVHTGSMKITSTTFEANNAGKEGMAILSVGVLQEAINVTFIENTLHCPINQYGFDKDINEDASGTCRSALVCTRCSKGCDSIPDIVSMLTTKNGTIPVCEEVPIGTYTKKSGATIETLVLEKGYYRTSRASVVVLECYLKDACVGGTNAENYCATGYKGPYCAVCAEGYAPSWSFSCHRCSGVSQRSALGLAVAAILAVLLVVTIFVSDLVRVVDDRAENTEGANGFWERKFLFCHKILVKAFPLTTIKIVVIIWQIVTQFAGIAGNVYPHTYGRFISTLSPVNLDIGFLLSYSCIVTTNFYHRLLAVTLGPLFAIMVLTGTYTIARKRNRNSDFAMRAVQHKHLSAALFMAFFIYASVSFTIFQTFVCDTLDDGRTYLRSDYSLTCTTKTYSTYRAYAIIMVCVYPVGIPAAFTWWLARNRQNLKRPNRETLENLEPLKDLWAAYKPSRYYYEVIECGRRITLTGIAVFVLPNSAAQIAFVLFLAVVFVFISESLSPFEKQVNMGLYRWGNGVILASMYVALLLKFDVSNEDSMYAFSVLLIAAHVFMIVTVVVQSVLLLQEWRAEIIAVDVPVQLSHTQRLSL